MRTLKRNENVRNVGSRTPDVVVRDSLPSVQRVLIVLIPTLAYFGPAIPVVGPFFAFRIVVFLLFIVTLCNMADIRIVQASRQLFALWLLCGQSQHCC